MSTTATLALKACPFCGDTDTKVFGESAPEWWVTCMGCRASSPCRTTRPQAIAGWNRRAALAQRTDPWRQAVDEALIAHALDCTGPGDDPKEKVKELIEWAVTIATDPRVSDGMEQDQPPRYWVHRERSYSQRAKAIIAFNTCSGDLDDKLNAAWEAALAADKKGEV